MANVRLSMRKIQEILRLCWHQNLSTRQVAASCGIGQSTVVDYLARAKKAGLSWPLPEDLDEATLEHMLFAYPLPPDTTRRNMPSFEYLHTELRKKHVTLQLLWHEYREKNPEGYQYSQFCLRYRTWAKTLDISLRQDYKAGEKLFVDYAGDTIPIHDPATGTTTQAYLFVATLGASNYSYVEAVLSQELPSWIGSHIHTFEFMGAVPEIVVPDNPESGVTHPCRYEPDLNPTYQDMATHYGTAVIPARVKKAQGQSEGGVEGTHRGTMDHRRVAEPHLLQHRRSQPGDPGETGGLQHPAPARLKVSRKHLFETIDKPAMKPLPEQRYEYAEWEKHKANIDYHVEVDHHYYSVPYQLRGAGGGRPHHGDDGGDSSSRETGGLPSEELSGRQAYDMPRAHAGVPQALPRMDALPHRKMGTENGTLDGGARQGDHGEKAPSGTGLPVLARHHAPGKTVRIRERSRLPAPGPSS